FFIQNTMAAKISENVLASVLEPPEVDALSDEVKCKLESKINSLQSSVDELKQKNEELLIDKEQRCFNLEKQLISSTTKREESAKENTELKQQLKELETKYNETTTNLREVNKREQDFEKIRQELERSNAQLKLEKQDVCELLTRKEREITRLNEEWSSMCEKVAASNQAKCEALAQLEEFQTQEVTSKFREKRLEQEKEQLQQQNTWVDQQLQEKTSELQNFRKERSAKILELQSLIQDKDDEIKQLTDNLEAGRVSQDTQAEKIQDYMERLKKSRDNQSKIEEQYRNELQAQTKLVTLYKESAEESEKKSEELISAMKELQRLLKEASNTHTDIEQERLDTAKKYQDQIDKRDVDITKLKNELEVANELLESRKKGMLALTEDDIEALAPTAAATSKLLKSGKTLSQVYYEHVELSRSLDKEKQENKRLNNYMDMILEEIEQKAPMLVKQRENYETSLTTIENLTRQMETGMLECEKLRVKADDEFRRSNHLGRENERLQQETRDLGQQVRMLLKELEEARGTVVSKTDEDMNVSHNEVSSSSNLISEKLVTFRSIEELQEQNQRLIGVVRELSEKKEKEEIQASSDQTKALQHDLEAAMSQIEEMKSARGRQEEMVKSIVMQRDMYRVLLSQSGGSPLPPIPMQSSTPGPIQTPQTPVTTPSQVPTPSSADKRKLEETTTALNQLKREFDTYKKDKGENYKMINEQLEKVTKEVNEFRVQNAKLASQLDFATERYKIVQTNNEGFKREIDGLREKNQKFHTAIGKHEQTINTLRQEVMSSQENLARAQVQCDNLRAEKQLLKTAEERLILEKESLYREQRSQNVVLANLQTLQNNQERAEFEMKTKLNQQLETYEKEVNVLRRKLETTEDHGRDMTRGLQRELRDMSEKLQQERDKHCKTREELIDAFADVHALKQKLSESDAKLASAETHLKNVTATRKIAPDLELPTPPAAGSQAALHLEEISDLKVQLRQANEEISNLKGEVSKSEGLVAQYKSIAQDIEDNLKEQNQTSKQFSSSLENKLQEAQEGVTRLEKQLDVVEKERQNLLNQNIKLNEDSHALNADLRKQCTSLQNELEETASRREEAIRNEQLARDECNAQLQLATEAQSKYEREMMLHAENIKATAEVKQKLEGFNRSLAESEDKRTKAEQALAESKQSWEEQEKILKSECEASKQRCETLEQQSLLLHEQLEALSKQLSAVRETTDKHDTSYGSLDLSISEENTKSSEQLLQVIRFLRREKEIAQTTVEAVEAERTRLTQQVEQLNANLQQATNSLNEERKRSVVNMQSSAQHAELMRKVENLNILTDSNQLLREERDQLSTHVKEIESKIQTLESKLSPLEETNRHLTGQNEAIQIENENLRGEVERWKARTNTLVEQSMKSDPEEHKKLVAEKEDMRKKLAMSTEEMHKNKAALSRVTANMNKLQSELQSSRQELTRIKTQHGSETIALKNQHNNQVAALRTQHNNVLTSLRNQHTSAINTIKAQHNTELNTAKNEQSGELTTTKNELTTLRNESNSYKQQIEKLVKELNTMKSERETVKAEKEKENEEKTKTINQLKKIGRKYRMQAEDIQKEMDKLKAAQQTQPPSTTDANSEALQEQTKELEQKLKDAEAKNEELTKKLTEMSESEKDAENKAKEFEAMVEERTQKLKGEMEELQTRLKTENQNLTQTIDQLNKDIKAREEAESKLLAQKTELEKKQESSSRVMQTVKVKLTTMKDATDRLSAEKRKLEIENKELKSKSGATSGVPDSKISEFEAQLAAKSAEVTAAKSVETDLRRQLETLQRQIESLQRQLENVKRQPPSSSSSGQVERIGTVASEPPPTANIRPTIAPSSQTRHPNPSSLQTASSRATASIRPMAVAAVAQTPTATVMPTTVNTQEAVHETAQRPTQQVQAVQPHVDVVEQDNIVQVQGVASFHEEATTITVEVPDQADNIPTIPIQPRRQEPAKRQRDDSESQEPATKEESSPQIKRPRSSQAGEEETLQLQVIVGSPEAAEEIKESEAETQQIDDSEFPTITVTEPSPDNYSQDIDADIEEGKEDDAAPAVEAEPTTEEAAEKEEEETLAEQGQEPVAARDEEKDESDDDIIEVASDSEEEEEDFEVEVEGEYEEEEEELEGEGEFEEEQEDGDNEEENIEDFEEEESEGMEEEYDQSGEEEDDDNMQEEAGAGDADESSDDCIEILSDDDDDGAMESQPTGGEQQSAPTPSAPPSTTESAQAPSQQPQPVPPRQLPAALMRVPVRTERLPSVGRTQGNTFAQAPFEEGDDGIVPSTPTLFVPKRNDGFAEAVSSPLMPLGSSSFTFGRESLNLAAQTDMAQLVSQGGMDDTRIDLTQLEDGTGRSVPSTPLNVSAPITPEPSAEGGNQQVEQPSGSASTEQVEQSGDVVPDTEQQARDDQLREDDLLQEDQSQDGTRETGEASATGDNDQSPPDGDDDNTDSQGSRKKIEPIVWDSPPAPTTQAIPSLLTMQPQQPRRGIPTRATPPQRGGPPRGGMMHRGRGGATPGGPPQARRGNFRGTPTRGGPNRGGRGGGMRGGRGIIRQPPQY
ncbi:unnamed protein product, partial [Owenia fusiformis]